MKLTHEQKQEFYERGVLKLPGIVPQELVLQARRAINAFIGQNGMDPNELSRYSAQSYCPGLGSEPVITDLYNASPLKAIAESLIGAGAIKPVRNGQIALRFPSLNDTPREPGPHIDGMYTPTNGVKKGTVANFTALVGVFLSDLPEPYAGNFTAWPGSHRTYETYFREQGAQALINGLPPVEIGKPEQLIGLAGDAVLCHYQLGHGNAGNISPNTRYALFFRLVHVDHENYHWECMTDIWREWAGMADFALSKT